MAQAQPEIIDAVERRDYFISSNGLELQLKKVSRWILADISKKIKMPKVPTVFIEEKGREEANPNDPDYLEAKQEAEYDRVIQTYAALIAVGTVIARMPSDMEGPDGEEWIELLHDLEIFDVNRDSKKLRYAAWLKYVGMPDNADFDHLTQQVLRFSGLTREEDVQAAEEAFRGESGETADTQRTLTAPG